MGRWGRRWWLRRDEGMEKERRSVTGPRRDWGIDRCEMVDGGGEGIGEEGSIPGEVARAACLGWVQSETRKTGDAASGRYRG